MSTRENLAGKPLKLVNDSQRDFHIVLVSAEEPRANAVSLDSVTEPSVPGIEVSSAARLPGERVRAAKRCQRYEMRYAHHPMDPQFNPPSSVNPVAPTPQCELECRIGAVLRSKRGRELSIRAKVSAMEVVIEGPAEAIEIPGDAGKFVENDVSEAAIYQPIVVLQDSVDTLRLWFRRRFRRGTQSEGIDARHRRGRGKGERRHRRSDQQRTSGVDLRARTGRQNKHDHA